MTSELLDEIAWRVAEQIRRNHPEAAAQEPADPALKPGKILMIRYRWPRLPWPFRLLQRRRRHEHPLTTARIRA